MPLLAFRCKHCGKLHEAGHAGVNSIPLACCVCGYGVKFDQRTGLKTPEPENWEVLADCTDARLKELDLTKKDVCQHTVDLADVEAKNKKSCEEAKAILLKKKQEWEAKPFTAWQQDLTVLNTAYDKLAAKQVSDFDHGDQEHDKSVAWQQIDELLKKQWTERDEAHLAEVEKGLLKAVRRTPRNLSISTGDKTRLRQFSS